MGTTSNMSIPYPESSDYVADGATAMENIAEQIDSKTGLVFISSNYVGASNVPSYTVYNCFSATFNSYYITITNLKNTANQPDIKIQLGTTTSLYYTAGFYINQSSGSLTGLQTGATTSWSIASAGNNVHGSYDVTILDPYVARRTFFSAANSSVIWRSDYAGFQDSSSSFTDFTISASSGLIADGLVNVYGFTNG